MEIKLNPNLSYECKERTIIINGESKKLTTTEMELFNFLAIHMNKLMERKEALKMIWGEESYFSARSMDVYITKLRKILRPLNDVSIINIHNKGYKLVVDNAYDLPTVSAERESTEVS